MIFLTKKPVYNQSEFDCSELAASHIGGLLAENSRNIEGLASEIRVLSEESANKIWKLTFGEAKNKAAITNDNWTSTLYWSSSGDWLPHYNRAESEPVEHQLRHLVDWCDDQVVLFLKGPHDCVVTSWRSFVRNWLTFFEYDDDGPFVIPVDRSDVLRISPNGTFLKGTEATG